MIHNSRLVRAIRMTRLIAAASVLGAVVTIGVAALSARSADNPMKWAEDHKGALPKTLAEIAAYPSDYRSAIFTAEPDSLQLTMIRQHVVDLLASKRLTLSDEQRRFLQRHLEMANSAQHFSDLPSTCTELQTVFPVISLRNSIRTVGSETAPSYRFTSFVIWARLAGRGAVELVRPVVVSAEEEIKPPLCNCHEAACDCPAPISCNMSPNGGCTTPAIGLCHQASFMCSQAHVCDGYTPSCYGVG